MLSKIKEIEKNSLLFPKELRPLYSLIEKHHLPIHIIPTCIFNHHQISFYPKEIINKLNDSKIASISIATCNNLSELIKQFFSYYQIKNVDIYTTLECFTYLVTEIDNQKTLKSLLKLFSLDSSNEALHNLKKICQLPPELLIFCKEKNYAFKQLKQLTLINKDIITLYLENIAFFNFSARNFEETLFLSNDLIRRNILTRSNLNQTIKKIKENSNNESKKATEKLKVTLQEMSQPILTTKNNQIKEKINALQSSPHISLSWDKTLENKGLKANILLKNESSITEILTFFTTQKNALSNIIKDT